MPDTEDSPLPPHREGARASSSLAASPPVAETLDSLLDLFTPPAVERLAWPLADEAGVIVECLRADTLDSEISGNKAWKLRLPLARALSEKRGIISCGGGTKGYIF